MLTLPALSLFLACNPIDADVSGSYVAYLQDKSSENIVRLERDGKKMSELADKLDFVAVDCRDLSALGDDAQAAERLDGVNYDEACKSDGAAHRLDYFTWLDDYAYWRKEASFAPDGELQAYRTEAVMTAEGDLQLTVHVNVDGIGDFRFGWTIDPLFQPTECRDTADGGAQQVNVDGNWLEGWKQALGEDEEGLLWPLNANAYQINPSNAGQQWYLPQWWMAGVSFARLEDEEFFSHATDYADPEGIPLYLNAYAGTDGYYPAPRMATDAAYDNWIAQLKEYHANVTDTKKVGGSAFEPKFYVEDNSWRPQGLEGASGLDGWAGVMPGWVRIKNPQDIVVGTDNPVEGDFQIYLEGLAAASKLLVRANFTIHEIREDVWGYGPTLQTLKREENGTPVCGSTAPVAVEE